MVLAITEEGGVTAAGERLGISQSALSHQLARLEALVGLTLFDRVGKRMSPTPIGRVLAESALDILKRAENAERSLVHAGEGRAVSILRVATSCESYYTWLARILSGFAAKSPDVDIRIELRSEGALSSDDEPDLLITAHPLEQQRGRRMAELFSQEVVAVVAANHPLVRTRRRQSCLAWGDLREETLLIHDLPSSDEVALRTAVWGAKRGGRRIVRRVQLTETLVALAAAGFGVGIVNRGAAAEQVAARAVEEATLVPRYDRRYWGVWRSSSHLPLAELAAFIVEQARKPSPGGSRPR